MLIAALNAATEFARKLTELTKSVGNFFTAHDPMAESVAAAAVAMNEEARQALQLTQNLLDMKTVSIDVLGTKAALVEATLRQIEADQQAAIAAAKLKDEYQDAARKAEQSRQVIDTLIEYATAYDAFTGKQNELTAEQAADMERFAAQLREATAIQEQILAGAGELGPEYQQAVTNLEFLKALMIDVEGSTVDVDGAVEDVGDGLNFAQRVAQFLEGYVGGAAENAAAASGNVSALQRVLSGAAAAAASLARAMASAASQLGPLGSALSALGSGGILGRVTGGIGGVLGGIINSDAVDAAGNRLAQLGTTMKVLFERSKAAAVAQDAFASSVGSAGGAAGGAAKKVEDFADEIERLEDAADPARKFRREMEELDTLLENGLSDGAYRQAVEDLNAEFVETSPILSDVNDAFGQMVDYMFDGFKDGMKGILNIFVNTLKSMAATALKNKITIGIGAAATGAGGAAAAGVPGGSGLLSNLGGLWGTADAAGLFGGSGLLGMGGGTGLLGLGAESGLATFLGGGTLGTIGSYAIPILGVGLALAGLFKKTEVLVAEGVRARIDGASLELDSYEKTKTENGLGMSSGFSRDFDRLDDAVQSVVQTRLDATITTLEQFGFGTDLTGFSFSKRTEIKDGETFEGESEEVIREALSAAIEYATDGALDAFTRSGEDMAGTLERLVTSLNSVNPILATLGDNILPLSLDGAAAASALADLAGGLEAFGGKAAFVFENFLTDQERLNFATQQLNATFGAMSVALPETHAQFRALMDAQDLTTEAGRQLYAALLDVAPLFVEVKGTAQDAAGALAEVAAQNSAVTSAMSDLRAAIAAEVSPLQDQLRLAQDAMRESESVANALRGALRNMRTESQRSRVRASAQATLSSMLAAGRVNDTEAFRDALSVVQEPSENLFGSFVEYQRDFFRTANVISSLETKADRQLSADQRAAMGIETQISQLNALIGQYDTQISATKSVADAVRSLEAALMAQQTATAGATVSREDAYLAANPDVAAAVAAGMFSSGAEHFALHGQFEDRPAFANGGTHRGGMRLVGERGPELEVTGPSRIYSARQTSEMMHDDVLRKEVREMKEYMRELVKINNRQERSLKEIEFQGEAAT